MVKRGNKGGPDAKGGAPRGSGEVVRPSLQTIFVADDDPDVRSVIRSLLVSEGHVVIEARDGSEAVEFLANAADGRAPLPSLLLLDFVMPGLSGLGVLRVLRQFHRAPPTVIMTGFRDPSVETFASKLGALRVLHKPIDEMELLQIVSSLAKGRGVAQEG